MKKNLKNNTIIKNVNNNCLNQLNNSDEFDDEELMQIVIEETKNDVESFSEDDEKYFKNIIDEISEEEKKIIKFNEEFNKDKKSLHDKHELIKSMLEKVTKMKKMIQQKSIDFDKHLEKLIGFSEFINSFNNTIEITCWKDLTIDFPDQYVIKIKNDKHLRHWIYSYRSCHEQYSEYSKKYWVNNKKLLGEENILMEMIMDFSDKYDKNIKFKSGCNEFSTGIKIPSSGERKIINILDNMEDLLGDEYEICYLHSHSWYFVRDVLPLESDFYVFVFHKGFIHQINIEFDGRQHFMEIPGRDFKYIHRHDILRQFYMRKLGIHVLRLNDTDSDIEKSIIKFIKQVVKSDKYIISNGIVPIKEHFTDKTQHPCLIEFNNFYNEIIVSGKVPIYNTPKFTKQKRQPKTSNSTKKCNILKL